MQFSWILPENIFKINGEYSGSLSFFLYYKNVPSIMDGTPSSSLPWTNRGFSQIILCNQLAFQPAEKNGIHVKAFGKNIGDIEIPERDN